MRLLQILFFLLIVRPILFIILGVNIRNKEGLPKKGPAIIVANHNSHLDTLLLMSLFPFYMLHQIRPIAAADYFLRKKWISWFSLNIMNILPLERQKWRKIDQLFAEVYKALAKGEIVILYPEGTRGEPEQLQRYKSGIYHLMKKLNEVPIYPVFIHGFGKALPKGDPVLVPLFVDVFVGEKFFCRNDRKPFMEELNHRMSSLANMGNFSEWD
ncbi:1-acyl-sn-glycerol-3-phosphate acyltransferases [Seinonella peptonophila]|uniref:1-acyl-sn-glycerol-3-phosphate acyltransferases n=1 Tax=Seinonella peptonophila TaxID=112248 RepID=A0A1M5AWF8_9BACL|nr:lysophospholipid acyltransferase family protein [Seinonella peptonophila]SHF34272.1 1-acyl-sn-glycerol-3-phosphate acyltransferases [Seinonella peptonophila]